ncbi:MULTISPECIES: hypothetical protein [unclassified Bacillus (in: firmicutes)]|uniref:hypothetical protein n=1 Tax=unclassified Bacillus (in: firmicutes) TaxID=185979 RepID=UPI0008E79FF3|nr:MULTISPECIES: hypothetical protein [unclassified Bacillus (in: firmicutes)]PGZ91915.1 hypothetical protein COE53_11040 [Bacillus sp. AFS029533]SFD54129.1 hypothetical protein SAMN02799633_04074 [Bacillus sp. UNCCL81]
MRKMTLKLTIEKKEYIIEEDQRYIFEFKSGYELNDSENPYCKCLVIDLSLALIDDDGRSIRFYVLDEESGEDYLIAQEELLSIINI